MSENDGKIEGKADGFGIGEAMVLLSLVVILVFPVYEAAVAYQNQQHRAYSAWVKLTGNESRLTFDEWNDLRRSRFYAPQGDGGPRP